LSENDLRIVVSQFGEVLQYSERHSGAGDPLARALCELFAMKYAYKIRACLGEFVSLKSPEVVGYESMSDPSASQGRLPSSDEASIPARRLLQVAASDNTSEISSALAGMGVFELCPLPEQQFWRMERIAERVIGRAKLVFWVELAFFATEIEDYKRASRYASEARGFSPVAWESYSLSIIEGLAVLSAGNVDGAVRCLNESIDACLTDVRACLECGKSPPNFLLVDKLLACGKRVEVLRHLVDCKFVWRIFGARIEEWIRVIESLGRPDFGTGGTWRLATQYHNVISIASGEDLEWASSRESRDQVVAEVERMRAEFNPPKHILPSKSAREKALIGKWPGCE